MLRVIRNLDQYLVISQVKRYAASSNQYVLEVERLLLALPEDPRMFDEVQYE